MGLVTVVTCNSSSPLTLLLSVSALCIVTSIPDKVTLPLVVWVVMATGVGVFGSVKKLLAVFMCITLGVVASTLVPVVRMVYSQALYSVYATPSVILLPDGGLAVFTVKPWLLVLTFGVVRVNPVGVATAMLVVLSALQDLQQMRWNAGIMQYCWSIAILHNIERSVRHREPITQQSEDNVKNVM